MGEDEWWTTGRSGVGMRGVRSQSSGGGRWSGFVKKVAELARRDAVKVRGYKYLYVSFVTYIKL